MEITKANRKWLDDLHLSHPVVIAGPCSAETEEKVLKIAHALTTVLVFGNRVLALVCSRA